MGRRQRKRSAAEKAARRKRREEFETVFLNGKQKRIRRPPTIDGLDIDDFIRANADPIFLHQEGLWHYLEAKSNLLWGHPLEPAMSPSGRERVDVITTETGDDLLVAFAVALDDPGEIASLILQRSPKFEVLLPQEERGVDVSHELFPEPDSELATSVVVDGSHVDIATRTRTYRIDVSAVDAEEIPAAWSVLRQMHRYGGFKLDFR